MQKKCHSIIFTNLPSEEIQNCSMKLSWGEAKSNTEEINTGEASPLAVLIARSPSLSFPDLF